MLYHYGVKMASAESVKTFYSRIGKDRLLVQGTGGNVSWKEADMMWIKASGTWLDDALEENLIILSDMLLNSFRYI